MIIHNFIRMKSKTNYEFMHYEDENIVEDQSDDDIREDQFLPLTVTSSREMNLIRNSIIDEIIEHISCS